MMLFDLALETSSPRRRGLVRGLVLVLVLVLGAGRLPRSPTARTERLQPEPVRPVVMDIMLPLPPSRPAPDVVLAFEPSCGGGIAMPVVEIGPPGAFDAARRTCIEAGVDLSDLVALHLAEVSEGCVGHIPALESSRTDKILPRADDEARMLDDRATLLTGIVKVCIDAAGRPTSSSILRSTGYVGYDGTLVAAVEDWRFKPHWTSGNPAIPACGIIELVYHVP